MKEININLSQYKGDKSLIYVGKDEGKKVREALELDKLDKDKDAIVVFNIPYDTISFNPSFYLGLLYKSYQTLGIEGIKNKYRFEFETKDEEVKNALLNCVEDGKRYASNSLIYNFSV